MNYRRVVGTLEMLVQQAQYGVSEGIEIPLKAVEELFCDEGLYEALNDIGNSLNREEYDLVDAVRDLWESARRHNEGLGSPHATERIRELKAGAERMTKCVERVRQKLGLVV